jgi:hypothetical protein
MAPIIGFNTLAIFGEIFFPLTSETKKIPGTDKKKFSIVFLSNLLRVTLNKGFY